MPRILTNPSTAEMIKYASNAVLATMISFSNEIARLCSAVGNVDALDVMKGVHQATYFTSRAWATSASPPALRASSRPAAALAVAACPRMLRR